MQGIGGGGEGGWLVWLLTTYALYPLTETKRSDLPNQGLSPTALWRQEDFSQDAFSRTTYLLMLCSFNLRCYTTNVGPFPKEGSVLQTFQQKHPTLVVCLSRFKETTSVGPFWVCRFSTASSATRCMLTNTASAACWHWQPVNWNDKFSVDKAKDKQIF